MNDINILVVAGHGRDTAGKRSPNFVFREWAWNKDVAEIVVDTLKAKGYKAVLINPEEEDISLEERCRRANSYGKNSILVSVHVNAAKNGEWANARGWSVWTTRGQTKSDELAEDIYQEAVKKWGKSRVRQDRSDGDNDYEKGFYILRHTNFPSVLVENFFMDNKEDYEYLLTPNSMYECAEVMVEGILKYINK